MNVEEWGDSEGPPDSNLVSDSSKEARYVPFCTSSATTSLSGEPWNFDGTYPAESSPSSTSSPAEEEDSELAIS